MPRTLLILRHAKAQKDSGTLPDYQRPLTGRGHRQATAVGEYLRDHGTRPEVVVASSGSRRTPSR